MAFYFCTKENTELILVFLLTRNKLYCIGLSDDFTKMLNAVNKGRNLSRAVTYRSRALQRTFPPKVWEPKGYSK